MHTCNGIRNSDSFPSNLTLPMGTDKTLEVKTLSNDSRNTCTTYGASRLWWHVCTCGVVVANLTKNLDSTELRARRVKEKRVESSDEREPWTFAILSHSKRISKRIASVLLSFWWKPIFREIFQVVSPVEQRKRKLNNKILEFLSYLPRHRWRYE